MEPFAQNHPESLGGVRDQKQKTQCLRTGDMTFILCGESCPESLKHENMKHEP